MALFDDNFALIRSGTRSIGFIVPDVVTQEINRDTLIVTDHPVEIGAAISDHAFMAPFVVEMRCGWSDSTAGVVGYIDAIYAELQALQQAREPFNVTTGKRAYSNMLISDLLVTTDEHSENTLMVIARLRQVIITSTQTTGAPSYAQANPSKTASTSSMGTRQLFAAGSAPGRIGAV